MHALVLLLLSSTVATIEKLPVGWVERAPPPEGSSEWVCANHLVDISSSVSNRDGKLHVEPNEPGPFVHEHQLPDGRLVGWSQGEWGGKLEWRGQGEAETILECNVRAILRTEEGLHVACGLSHLGLTEGAVYRLSRLGSGRWTTVDTVRFPYSQRAPNDRNLSARPSRDQAVHLATHHPDGGLLVVTTEGLSRVHWGWARRIAGHPEGWELLYPNSLAVVDRRLYVGMRYAVAAFDLDGARDPWWLVPEDCAVLVRAGAGGCTCAGPTGASEVPKRENPPRPGPSKH